VPPPPGPCAWRRLELPLRRRPPAPWSRSTPVLLITLRSARRRACLRPQTRRPALQHAAPPALNKPSLGRTSRTCGYLRPSTSSSAGSSSASSATTSAKKGGLRLQPAGARSCRRLRFCLACPLAAGTATPSSRAFAQPAPPHQAPGRLHSAPLSRPPTCTCQRALNLGPTSPGRPRYPCNSRCLNPCTAALEAHSGHHPTPMFRRALLLASHAAFATELLRVTSNQ
jgi:hypothetical protein